MYAKIFILCFLFILRSNEIFSQDSLKYHKEDIFKLVKFSDSLFYSEPEKSLELLNKALKKSNDIKDDSLFAVAVNRIGAIHTLYGDLIEALNKLQFSLQVADIKKYEQLYAKNFSDIGDVYSQAQLELDALDYYGIEQSTKKKYNDNTSLIDLKIGKTYLSLHNYDSAGNYFDRLFEEKKLEEILLPILYLNQAKLLFVLSKDNLKLADSLCSIARKKSLKINNLIALIQINHFKAELELEKGNISKANEYAKESIRVSEKLKSKLFISISHEVLAKCMAKNNQYKDAFIHTSISKVYLDSVRNKSVINELELLSYYQKLFKYRVLETKNDTNKNIATQRRLINIILTVALVFFIILLVIIIKNSKKITKQKLELEQLNKFKSKVFAILSHDVQSPIRSVIGVVELFHKKLVTKEEIKPLLPEIEDRMNKLQELLNNLLQWGGTQIEKDNVIHKPVDILNVVKKLELDLEDELNSKKIMLNYNNKTSCIINTNKDLLIIILRNIITNAIKFSYERSNIQINCIKKENAHIISIKDDGIGMNKKFVKKIFTGDLTGTIGTKGEIGNGVGLALCKDFIRILGGEITVESEVKKGTTFFITFYENIKTTTSNTS